MDIALSLMNSNSDRAKTFWTVIAVINGVFLLDIALNYGRILTFIISLIL